MSSRRRNCNSHSDPATRKPDRLWHGDARSISGLRCPAPPEPPMLRRRCHRNQVCCCVDELAAQHPSDPIAPLSPCLVSTTETRFALSAPSGIAGGWGRTDSAFPPCASRPTWVRTCCRATILVWPPLTLNHRLLRNRRGKGPQGVRTSQRLSCTSDYIWPTV